MQIENAIEIKNLTKTFNSGSKLKKALDNISFNVEKGSFHGFIGNNGSGKTTTFRTLLGFYPDAKGEVLINGISYKDEKSRKVIGYVPEVAIFPKNLTIREYVYYFAELSGLNKVQANEKTDELLKKFGFDSKEFNKSATKLSSGQKKKILLMQALVNDPEILVLDEPAANLDPSARIELYKELKELSKEGKTIFISSHILLELEKYIDSFTILSNGKVTDSGTIKEKLLNNKYNKKIIFSELNDLEKIENIVKKYISSYQIQDNQLFIFIDNQEMLNEFILELTKEKIYFDQIINNKMTLNEMYFSSKDSE